MDISIYISCACRADVIKEDADAIRAAVEATGNSLDILAPWWETGGASGLDKDCKPVAISKSDILAPRVKIDTLSVDCKRLLKMLKSRKRPLLVVFADKGPMKSTVFVMGAAASETKKTVLVSPEYCDWMDGVDGAPQPTWVGNLAMTDATCVFVRTVDEAAKAIVDISAATQPKSKGKKKAKRARAAKDDDEEDEEPETEAADDE